MSEQIPQWVGWFFVFFALLCLVISVVDLYGTWRRIEKYKAQLSNKG